MTAHSGRLAGRRILVTGAASGMGAAIARRFVREGARIALLDITKDALTAIAGETVQPAFSADVADGDAVGAAADAAAAALGGLDGVVNAAGVLREGAFETMEPQACALLLAVNLAGPINVCRAALPHLRQAEHATIVNISSMASLRPPPGLAVYAATKAGLTAFGTALAGELGPTIRLNTICPGVIRTPMIESHFDGGYMNDELMARLNQLGRPGTADEVADAALYFTADESSFVSAGVLAVNGGQLL